MSSEDRRRKRLRNRRVRRYKELPPQRPTQDLDELLEQAGRPSQPNPFDRPSDGIFDFNPTSNDDLLSAIHHLGRQVRALREEMDALRDDLEAARFPEQEWVNAYEAALEDGGDDAES